MLPLWKSRYENISGSESYSMQFHKSDIVVFAPPKCGTTWVTHICHQIRTRGSEVAFDDQDNVMPWIERLGTPYLEGTRFNDEPNADHVAEPRVFKSHLGWDDRPVGSFKQIWVFRDCIDMLVSVSHFLPSLWGIDPPLSEEEMRSFLLDAGDIESAFNSLVSVWEHHTDSNILLLCYENILDDHRGTVQRIANFMDVKLPLNEIDRIVDQTTKDGMLQNHEAFACRIQAKNVHQARGMVLDETALVGKVQSQKGKGTEGNRKTSNNKADIILAVERSWHYIVARRRGFKVYESMRCAVAQ